MNYDILLPKLSSLPKHYELVLLIMLEIKPIFLNQHL